mgnify:CR=1 FL=1
MDIDFDEIIRRFARLNPRSMQLANILNKDSKLRYCFRYLYFHGSPYFHVSDAFDAVSELLDKQLFSDSKSDIVTNVFTDALVKIVQRGKTYPTR